MNWEWDSVKSDAGMLKKAKEVKILSLKMDDNDLYATFQGEKGEEYTTTLDDCSCPQKSRFKPAQACKHMVRLAMEVGVLDANGRTEQERFEDEVNDLETDLAKWAWYYYQLKKPLVTDAIYTASKRKYFEMLGDAAPKLSDPPQVAAPASDILMRDMGKGEIVALLEKHHIAYVDRVDVSGCLWIENTDPAADLLKSITLNNAKLQKAESAKAFKGKPALYYRIR